MDNQQKQSASENTTAPRAFVERFFFDHTPSEYAPKLYWSNYYEGIISEDEAKIMGTVE